MEGPKFDVRKLMKENFLSASETPELQSLSTYILIRTEDEEEYLLAENHDIDRCTFIGEMGDEFTFKDPNGIVVPCKKVDYKVKWVAIDTRTIAGTMLEAAYEELVYMIQNQLPSHLKGKIKF